MEASVLPHSEQPHSRLRSASCRQKAHPELLCRTGWQSPDPIVAAAGPDSDNPVAELTGDEAMAALESALAQLSERQRQVFMLRNFESLDVADTALALGLSDGSVKTHHSRALARLRPRGNGSDSASTTASRPNRADGLRRRLLAMPARAGRIGCRNSQAAPASPRPGSHSALGRGSAVTRMQQKAL
jgi:DNA-binding CsgD family transcriptional regulator